MWNYGEHLSNFQLSNEKNEMSQDCLDHLLNLVFEGLVNFVIGYNFACVKNEWTYFCHPGFLPNALPLFDNRNILVNDVNN